MVHCAVVAVVIKAHVVAEVNAVRPQPRYEEFFCPALRF